MFKNIKMMIFSFFKRKNNYTSPTESSISPTEIYISSTESPISSKESPISSKDNYTESPISSKESPMYREKKDYDTSTKPLTKEMFPYKMDISVSNLEPYIKFAEKLKNINLSKVEYTCYVCASAKTVISLICKYNMCSFNTFPYSVALMERLHQKMIFTQQNIMFFWYICLMVAEKNMNDAPYNNKSFSMIMGIPVEELNAGELEVLKKLNYNVNISIEEIIEIHENILKITTN